MQVSSDIVGMKLREYSTEIDWRQTTNFAAAVGDNNPRYFDDELPEGLVAQPLFAVAVSWPVIANLTEYVDLKEAAELLFTIVHYSEYIEFHRPVKPGDRLSAEGEVVAVLPRRSGTHVIFRFPFRDKKGTPVFTEYLGGMLRGVQCIDNGQGRSNIPHVPEFKETSSHVWEIIEPIGLEAPYVYDACTNITFPIHTSPSFARSVGLPGVIMQGTSTLARAVRELINREAGGTPEGLKKLSCRFRAMVIPGGNIKIRLLERRNGPDGKELFFEVLNGRGEKAISDGYAQVRQ